VGGTHTITRKQAAGGPHSAAAQTMKGESMRIFHLIYAVILILALAACAGADIKNTSSAPGRTAPDFALPDQDGKLWKLSDALKEHRAVVLAFYPKDDTRE
jgi:hypothetical protein